jgi:hypothetical protein
MNASPQPPPDDRWLEAGARLAVTLLPWIILLPGLLAFPYPSAEARYSDITITHYPNALYLLRALGEWRTVPLWSPGIFSGTPFAANPLSGLWYPPGWLALLLPLPLGFNLAAGLHLAWGGLGMIRLGRRLGLDALPAAFAGLAFAGLPKLFAHYGAGHLTLVYAVSWTPWLISTSLAQPGEKQPRGWPGVILALIFLADPRWAAYAGLLWLGWLLAGGRGLGGEPARPARLAWQGWTAAQLGLAALFAAPLALPLLEYTRLSTRAGLSPEQVLFASLPPERLLGFLLPGMSGGNHEWMIYPGAAVLCLALLGIAWPAVRKSAGFWLWVAGLGVLFSLGEAVPGLSSLASLPGLSLLRVPPRAMFLVGLALALLAAYSLQALQAGLPAGIRRWMPPALVGLCLLAAGLAAVLTLLTGRISQGLVWGPLMIGLASAWMLGYRRGKAGYPGFAAGMILLCFVDLAGASGASLGFRSVTAVMAEGAAAARYLSSQPGLFRVYSPSLSLPQHTAMAYGIELADGIDPLQLAAYIRFMGPATGIERAGYEIVPLAGLPDDGGNTPRYLPDAALLGRLNVAYLAVQYDLPALEGLEQVVRFGETRIYRNQEAKPRAWVQPVGVETGEQAVPATRLDWTPNRIALTASGPGRLVLSEVVYPGWQVWVDGARGELLSVDGLLRGVDLSGGSHRVTFVYRPASVYLGLAGAGLGALLWLAAGLWMARRG